jgi:ABC-type lipoprotein release transport system permease subunit
VNCPLKFHDAGSALALAAVTVVAGFIPARWASRADPMVALHHE